MEAFCFEFESIVIAVGCLFATYHYLFAHIIPLCAFFSHLFAAQI